MKAQSVSGDGEDMHTSRKNVGEGAGERVMEVKGTVRGVWWSSLPRRKCQIFCNVRDR